MNSFLVGPDAAPAPGWGDAIRRLVPETPFVILVRNFVNGFFESDLLPDRVDPRQALIGIVVLFMAPAMWMSFLPMLGKYQRHHMVWEQAAERGTLNQIYAEIELATWGDELLFTMYAMAVIGFVTFVVWDRLFPDRRDLMVLGTLPIADRTLLGAKLTALVLLVAGFAVAVNTPSALGMAAGARNSPVDWMPLRYLLAHAIVMPLAGLFVFCTLTALQTLLSAVVPPRFLRGVSIVAQLLCVVAMLEMLVFSMPISSWLANNALRLAVDPIVVALPPFWFLGLYETILGTEHAVFHAAGRIALGASGASLIAVAVAYAAGYRRAVRRVMESTEPRPIGTTGLGLIMRRLVDGLLARAPIAGAVITFVTTTLARNQRYKLLLALYLGIGLAFIIGGVASTALSEDRVLWATPSVVLLSIPLILSFFALVGLRVLFAIPTELRANWVFRMSETTDKTGYLRGIRAAMLILALPPIALATLPIYWWLWGPVLALQHTVVWLCLGVLLTELLLIGLHRIPFTCSYVPGRANVKLLWWLYLFALIGYAYQTARLELWLLDDPWRWSVAVGGIAVAAVAARLVRDRVDAWREPLRFESDDDSLQTLELMRPV